MLRRFFAILTVIILAVIFISWGSTGHYKISYNASLSFFTQMIQFNPWTHYLAEHASDADIRKATDPTESPKHYIDIDNYPEFISTHTIPQTWAAVVAAHGLYFVNNEGILPWATQATYDSLKNAMQQTNWSKAMFHAADLGHYVADGHMPLHITKNYDGQYSGNDGIHSRYESSMIYSYNSQIVYSGDTVRIIPNINQYIFNYLYYNYSFVDSVMLADDYAKSISSNTSSTAYKAALWSKTKKFTIMLFKSASHAFAELIFNAWMEAGSPPVGLAGISENKTSDHYFLLHIYPNPFNVLTEIRFYLPVESTQLTLEVFDMSGRRIALLKDGYMPAGNHQVGWKPEIISPGTYFMMLNNGKKFEVKKAIFLP